MARRPTPATASSPPTTRRSRPISRRRSTRRHPIARRASADPTAEAGPVVVLDFGSQFAQLIARRVRELDVYSELLPHDTPYAELERRGTRAIILSGGPKSVYDDGAPRPDAAVWSGRIPVLGHLLRRAAHGPRARRRRPPGRPPRVRPGHRQDHAPTTALFAGLDRDQPVWMSHGDSITRLPEGFQATAQTDSTPFAGLADPSRNLYGIQFHPEVVHTPRGRDVLRNFVVGIAGVTPTWTAANFIDTTVAGIRDRVDAPRARTGSDGQGHLRPVGRRRFGRRRGARPSRGRRPADLHLRRPRAHAQEGVGAAARRPSSATSA